MGPGQSGQSDSDGVLDQAGLPANNSLVMRGTGTHQVKQRNVQYQTVPHLLTLRKLGPGPGSLPHTALYEDMASCSPLLLLSLACPLATELAQFLVQPPLQLGPLGRVQGPVPGPAACIEYSFPTDPLPGMGASLFTAAVDLKRYKSSQGELWARETAARRSASKGRPKAGWCPFTSPESILHNYPVSGRHPEARALETVDRRQHPLCVNMAPEAASTHQLHSPSCCLSGATMALGTPCAVLLIPDSDSPGRSAQPS